MQSVVITGAVIFGFENGCQQWVVWTSRANMVWREHDSRYDKSSLSNVFRAK